MQFKLLLVATIGIIPPLVLLAFTRAAPGAFNSDRLKADRSSELAFSTLPAQVRPSGSAPLRQVFNVVAPEYGATGSYDMPEPSKDTAALIAALADAARVCGKVMVPLGHYWINQQIVWPSCVEIEGVGRTPAIFTVAGQYGSILDFILLPQGTDAIVTDPANAGQFSRLANLQIERASGKCLNASLVYGQIESVNLTRCGTGNLIKATSTKASYLTRLSNLTVSYSGGAEALKIGADKQGQQTTILLENVYATKNIGKGIVAENLNTLTIIGGGSDSNAGGYGYEITGSDTVSMIGVDMEANYLAGSLWSASSGTIISSRSANNNTSGTGFQPDFALLDNGAKITIIGSSTQIARTSASSVNALNHSRALVIGGSYAAPFANSSGGSVSQLSESGSLKPPTSCTGQPSGSLWNRNGTPALCP